MTYHIEQRIRNGIPSAVIIDFAPNVAEAVQSLSKSNGVFLENRGIILHQPFRDYRESELGI